jgi:hypothetical protein
MIEQQLLGGHFTTETRLTPLLEGNPLARVSHG